MSLALEQRQKQKFFGPFFKKGLLDLPSPDCPGVPACVQPESYTAHLQSREASWHRNFEGNERQPVLRIFVLIICAQMKHVTLAGSSRLAEAQTAASRIPGATSLAPAAKGYVIGKPAPAGQPRHFPPVRLAETA